MSIPHPTMALARGLIVVALASAAREVSGHAERAGVPGYTDASVVQTQTGNYAAGVFGPGRLAQAHTADEYAPIDHIVKAEMILTRTMQHLYFA